METIDVDVNGRTLKELLIDMSRVNIEAYSALCDQAGGIVERHASVVIIPQAGAVFHLVLVAVPIPEQPAAPAAEPETEWPREIGPDLY